MKKLEYIWLDGFKPEPSLRSKVKVTDESPDQIGLLMAHQHNKQMDQVLIVFSGL